MDAHTIDKVVSKAPMSSRRGIYHPGVEDDQEDCTCVLSIAAPPFHYTIPSFDVL